jgi:predicted RNA-binding protein
MIDHSFIEPDKYFTWSRKPFLNLYKVPPPACLVALPKKQKNVEEKEERRKKMLEEVVKISENNV